MKDFNKFLEMNESTSELTLLNNLYSFYLQKYTSKKNRDIEVVAKEKFKEQLKFLVIQGEVSIESIKKFYKKQGISDIYLPDFKTPVSNDSDDSDYGCGSNEVGCGSVPSYRKTVSRSRYDSGCGSSSSNVGC